MQTLPIQYYPSADYLFSSGLYKVKCGVVFFLKLVYFSQPFTKHRLPVKVSGRIWEEIQSVYTLARSKEHCDVVDAVRTLAKNHAFQFVAHTPRELELTKTRKIALRSQSIGSKTLLDETAKLVEDAGRMVEDEDQLRHSIFKQAIKSVSLVSDTYQQLKEANPGINLDIVQTGFVADLEKLEYELSGSHDLSVPPKTLYHHRPKKPSSLRRLSEVTSLPKRPSTAPPIMRRPSAPDPGSILRNAQDMPSLPEF